MPFPESTKIVLLHTN